ncbi:glycerophosphodiester phosphodiesterase [Subsaximicrobium wynnwilliamsii]|nr:glycerophosphodiester phosphodiesterase [Subsaximicrobium wynnwilliamsii]
MKKIDIQGHRGCRGLLPENSLPAFQKALDLGVTTLELDVIISADNKVVVSHEPYLNHEIALDLSGKPITEANELSYNLYQMPYDSIKKYDCGSKPHPRFPNQIKQKVYKPLLTEVIALAETQSGHKIQYNIEIKSSPKTDGVFTPSVEAYVALVLKIITAEGILERTTLQSFDVRALELFHATAPSVKSALLVDEDESISKKLELLSFEPDVISPYFELLEAKWVSEYQQMGYQIIPWTVNTEADILRMLAFDVDGIISDYPDRVISMNNSN